MVLTLLKNLCFLTNLICNFYCILTAPVDVGSMIYLGIFVAVLYYFSYDQSIKCLYGPSDKSPFIVFHFNLLSAFF